MPTRKQKPHDAEASSATVADDEAVEVPVDSPVDEPKAAPAINPELESLTPFQINKAIADRLGIPVTTRHSPVGVLCIRRDGSVFSPASRSDHAEFAARRCGLDVPVGSHPRDLCLQILSVKE